MAYKKTKKDKCNCIVLHKLLFLKKLKANLY